MNTIPITRKSRPPFYTMVLAEDYPATVGETILTLPMGEWLGGLATITNLRPDPAAPEIVFQVRNEQGEIGVYGHEQIGIPE